MAFTYPVPHAIHISLDGTTWYRLTDHNRSDLQVNPEPIEKAQRMANGTMRKYVIATKASISLSWEMIPSRTDETVDGGVSSEWMDAFYKANVFVPIQVRVYNAGESVPTTGFYPDELTRVSASTNYDSYLMFMSKYSSTVVKRTTHMDLVNMNLELTEI